MKIGSNFTHIKVQLACDWCNIQTRELLAGKKTS